MNREGLLKRSGISCLVEPLWQSMLLEVERLASRGICLNMEKRNTFLTLKMLKRKRAHLTQKTVKA